MAEHTTLTSDRIEKAVESVKALRPAYAEILTFYERVFAAQEASKSRIRIDPVPIPDAMLSMKLAEKFPLVDISEFVIDPSAAEALFERIRHAALSTGGDMVEEVENIERALNSGELETQSVFTSLLTESDDYLARTAERLGLDEGVLGSLAYSSIKPSLEVYAHALSNHLDPDASWDKGYCPICGSPPGLSVLGDQGARTLVCGFCAHQWVSRRIFCPFCENTDNDTLQYFYSEEEKEYRVDVCEKCKNYVKTVDLNKCDRIFHPPLEQVGTLHLDMKANEMGYASPL